MTHFQRNLQEFVHFILPQHQQYILQQKIQYFQEIPQQFAEQRRIFGFIRLFDINNALIDLTEWNAESL